MRIVIADEDDIPGWLYPEAFPELPRPPDDWAAVPSLGERDFGALWRAAAPASAGPPPLEPQYSNCDVGVPHDAPEWVERVNPALVAALAALPEVQRWQVAQAWAAARLGKRPNQRELTEHKEPLKALCTLARRSVESGRPLVLL